MGLLSRAELARHLRLSVPTVRKILRTGATSRNVAAVLEARYGMAAPQVVRMLQSLDRGDVLAALAIARQELLFRDLYPGA